jgi:uncharacterized protein
MRRRSLLAAAALPAAATAQAPRLPPPVPAPENPRNLPPGPLVPLDDLVAPGLRRDVLIRWGDRMRHDAPAWAPDRPDAEAAQGQFGWDAHVLGVLPAPPAADRIPRAILAVTHPTLDPVLAFPAGRGSDAAAQAAQGASILNLEYQGRGALGRWVVVDGGFQSRRITGSTLCRLSGPLAGEGGGDSVQGVLLPHGGGFTPWGSLLLAEADPAQAPAWALSMLPDAASRTRFGHVVELDPMDPGAIPVKRTALGRRAHGDVAAALAQDGRAVLYLSERQAGGFLYRFVSAQKVARGEGADNAALLDQGTLFAARRAGARVLWVRLPDSNAARLNPHEAARAVNATPLDHPSGLAVGSDSLVFLALAGSTGAGAVLELAPAGGDHGADACEVATLVTAGGRNGTAGFDAPFAAPEALGWDAQGQLLVATATRLPDVPNGLFAVPVQGALRGQGRRLYAAPRGAAMGGAAALPASPTLVAGVRHPGAGPGASFANPATRWPAFDAALPPRSLVVALTPG